MSESMWDGEPFAADEVIGERIRHAIEEADQETLRIQAYQDRVRDMPGQLGALLRQIAHAWSEFESADEFGNTTAAEEVRLRGVLVEAMSTVDWLREGEQ